MDQAMVLYERGRLTRLDQELLIVRLLKEHTSLTVHEAVPLTLGTMLVSEVRRTFRRLERSGVVDVTGTYHRPIHSLSVPRIDAPDSANAHKGDGAGGRPQCDD